MTLAARDALLSRLCGQAWPHQPLLEALKLSPALDVLDVGAGEGRLMRALAARGHQGRWAGVDPQPASSDVVAGSAEALPFPDHAFDVGLLVRVLAHVSNPAGALREARRVLRPGGQLVVAAHGPDHLRRWWARPSSLATSAPAPLPGQWDTLDLFLPIELDSEALAALARSYSLPDQQASAAPLTDTLHLQVWTAAP